MGLNIRENLSTFFSSSKRVLIIAKKPTWTEFQTMAKVTGIGIIVVAVIGYIITLIFTFAGIA